MLKYSNVIVTGSGSTLTFVDVGKDSSKVIQFDSEHDCDVAYNSIGDFINMMLARRRSSVV